MLTRPTCSECERPLPDEPGNRPGPARQTCSVRCRQIRARRKREERAAREATKIAFRHLVRDHGTDEEQAAYEDLAGRFPGFESTNASALRAAERDN